MRLQYTERFQRAYAALSDEEAARVDKAILLLAADPRYPGLRVKKMQGVQNIWEARASRSLRLTFELRGETIILRNVGAHDATLKKP